MNQNTQLDANQIIKKTYDTITGSVLTVPTYVPSTVLLNTSGNTSITSDPINILPYKVNGVIVSWSNLNQTDATIQFQGSIDGITYLNIGSSTTISTASGAQDFGLIDEPYCFVQLVYNHGSNTAGTVSAVYMQRA